MNRNKKNAKDVTWWLVVGGRPDGKSIPAGALVEAPDHDRAVALAQSLSPLLANLDDYSGMRILVTPPSEYQARYLTMPEMGNFLEWTAEQAKKGRRVIDWSDDAA